MINIPDGYLTTIGGKTYIRYMALFKLANANGLKSLTTEVVQLGSKFNGHRTIARSTLVMRNRTYTSIGEASPTSIRDWRSIPMYTTIAVNRSRIACLVEAMGIEYPVAEIEAPVMPTDKPLLSVVRMLL